MTDHRRVRIGDIVEIRTPRGFAYVQYTHEHPQYGSLVRVLPGLYAERPPDLSRLAQARHLWVVFFPVGVGVRRGMVELAAHADVPPEAAAFPLFKVAGLDDPKTGRVLNWGLWDGQRESFPVELSSEQWKLPTLEIVNLEALVHMIVTGWRPEHDALRGPRTGAGQAPEDRPEPGSQTVSAAGASPARHFLVLPSAAAARQAATAAGRDGFVTQLREPSEPEGEWGVIARTEEISILEARQRLEALAAKYGGEYDGWEAQPDIQASFGGRGGGTN